MAGALTCCNAAIRRIDRRLLVNDLMQGGRPRMEKPKASELFDPYARKEQLRV